MSQKSKTRAKLLKVIADDPQGLLKTEYTTDELTTAYEVIGFCAPFVRVKRKSDGIEGMMQFDHMPRKYYDFQAIVK